MTSYVLNEHETLTVRSRTNDTLEIEALYEPGTPPPMHWHPDQTEHFEILEGTLTVSIDGAQKTLHAGETITIASGTRHRMWNSTDVPARAIWRTTPGGRTEEWFERVEALNGRHSDLLDFAVAAREFRDVFRPAIKPQFAAGAVLGTLALLGTARSRMTRRQSQ